MYIVICNGTKLHCYMPINSLSLSLYLYTLKYDFTQETIPKKNI